ncbi:MAG: thiamine phosphate synthase [Planctomycetes bacterium]|nr:thiamine phosphate synthase [Planctomycetota bacterium]
MLRSLSKDAMPRPPFQLCLLLSRELCLLDPLHVLRESVAGGVDCVQLREKEMSTIERHAWSLQLMDQCLDLRIPLIVNDDVEVAADIGAHGVHLGQEDLPVHKARKLLRPNQWIGLSTHSLEQLDTAADQGVNYVGYGPIYPTGTKKYKHGLGPDSVMNVLPHARVPVVAIGGINTENAECIPERAALAVSSAICATDNPREVAAALRARRPIDTP